ALGELLGDSSAKVTCDRFSAYRVLELWRRQFCWSHLLREFDALAQCEGQRGRVGRALTTLTRLMFRVLRWEREGVLKVSFEQVAAMGHNFRWAFAYWIREASNLPRAPSWSRTLAEEEPGMWTWLEDEGVELSNNPAERGLRHGVLWRKVSFGVESERGARFAERMMSVVQSLRLQGRDTYTFLRELLSIELPEPSLLPSPS
ncbi:MAG: transposase, partial [Phycisphaerales bacterium]|nr:transposase [Phycisphaerales bacterium]